MNYGVAFTIEVRGGVHGGPGIRRAREEQQKLLGENSSPTRFGNENYHADKIYNEIDYRKEIRHGIYYGVAVTIEVRGGVDGGPGVGRAGKERERVGGGGRPHARGAARALRLSSVCEYVSVGVWVCMCVSV